jgi:phosphoglycolate phosphatase
MPRLVLWDIDGTLLRTANVGIEALRRAIERVTGRSPTGTLPYQGLLDRNIALQHLESVSADASGQVDAVLVAFEEEFEASNGEILERGYLLPGVIEILTELSKVEGVLQTVLTGNLRKNAELKLTSFGLDNWLDLEVGSYADDALERHELVAVSLRRATELRDMTFRSDEIWIVGDTRHDLACARAVGARCLLVQTGAEPLPESARAEADVLMPDLSDTAKVREIITG